MGIGGGLWSHGAPDQLSRPLSQGNKWIILRTDKLRLKEMAAKCGARSTCSQVQPEFVGRHQSVLVAIRGVASSGAL